MSESLSVDEGWDEALDSEQVTHVKGDVSPGVALAGEWLVNVSEQVVVPMTTTDVVDALRSKRVTDRSLVWRAGMQDWTPLGDVPPLRLAAGNLVGPSRVLPAQVMRVTASERVRVTAPASERVLHPPPKESARAARDERRRNTLPFGFPVVRDPATIREPAGLHAAPSAPPDAAPPTPAPSNPDESAAIAIYERATPSLTFSDSVRAEWQGASKLLHQPAPTPVPKLVARPAPRPRLEPPPEPKPRLSLEPQTDRKPRLSLEPQSDPQQSERAGADPHPASSQQPSSLAPITSEPQLALPARGAGMWGDLSVVLASDLRAVQATSKRTTLIASIGSAVLASLLTLWVAHASMGHAPEAPPPVHAAQPAPTAKAEPAAAPLPAPSITPVAVAASSAHVSAVPSSVARVAKPAVAAPPRVAARPKPAPVVTAEPEPSSFTSDSNPYAEPAERVKPKLPTAAFKETGAAPSAENPSAEVVPSGLDDSASAAPAAPAVKPAATSPAKPATTAAPDL